MPQVPPPKQAAITSSVMLWTLRGSFEEKLEIAARAGLQSVELVGEHLEWDDAGFRAARRAAQSFRLGMDTLGAMPNWGRMPVSMVDPAQGDAMLAEVGFIGTVIDKTPVGGPGSDRGDEIQLPSDLMPDAGIRFRFTDPVGE